ncbi:SDR family oxidoreductase [Novosphingobium sp. SL115]|uniref:SDR family oxidoreductase n=1 Tax=Novosphingobium sp. SL115 TaxID=2995150 RepID=UPI002274A28C|nr:SDR family oxidoreductase [Novosphingobium sp. SL115]MCY1672867.1 SDR family oxidoreductase [Novosphingobium sp. SL115]
MQGTDHIDLTGKVAIVTGGTRGLGRHIAQALLRAGAAVTVCGRTEPADLPAKNLPGGLIFRAADIRDPDQAQALVDAVAAQHGRLDILVNNAGGSPQAPATASPRFFDAIVKLNLHSAMYMSQYAYAHMQEAGGGSIINIASVSGIRPSPMTSAYGAAKAGLLSLTQSLAQEWGPDGVRVNAIIVGLMQTETSEETYGDAAAQAAVAKSLPLQRMGTGMDIAGAVLWLSSSLASWVSGARINVDGGGERPFFLDLVKGS